jgi:DNA replication regulator DPB11
MNRRGHLSSKIPNVKLRPVPAASTSTSTSSKSRNKNATRDPLNAMDEELIRRLGEDMEDEDESTMALRGITEKPWKGVVITFTGIENKVRLTHTSDDGCMY